MAVATTGDRHLLPVGVPGPARCGTGFRELADGADAAVAEVVDVIHVGRVATTKSHFSVLRVQDYSSSGVFVSLVFFKRPTRSRKTRLKNMFSKSDRKLSSVGGSPAQAPADLDLALLRGVDRIFFSVWR
jgi:hypothetical protein